METRLRTMLTKKGGRKKILKMIGSSACEISEHPDFDVTFLYENIIIKSRVDPNMSTIPLLYNEHLQNSAASEIRSRTLTPNMSMENARYQR